MWVFAYSAVYFTYLQSTMLATYVLYFGYMALLSLGLSLLTGCIGFYSCLWFTKKIYSSIKVRSLFLKWFEKARVGVSLELLDAARRFTYV